MSNRQNNGAINMQQDKMYDRNELKSMKVDELRGIAGKYNIRGRYKMNKDVLIDEILAEQNLEGFTNAQQDVYNSTMNFTNSGKVVGAGRVGCGCHAMNSNRRSGDFTNANLGLNATNGAGFNANKSMNAVNANRRSGDFTNSNLGNRNATNGGRAVGNAMNSNRRSGDFTNSNLGLNATNGGRAVGNANKSMNAVNGAGFNASKSMNATNANLGLNATNGGRVVGNGMNSNRRSGDFSNTNLGLNGNRRSGDFTNAMNGGRVVGAGMNGNRRSRDFTNVNFGL